MTNCYQLKLKVTDGIYRMIDVVDIEVMFRIIASIPNKNAESITVWQAIDMYMAYYEHGGNIVKITSDNLEK